MPAIDNVIKVLSGGFRIAWFIPLDQDGYFAGATGTLVPGPNNGQAGYFMSGVKTAAYKAIEPLVLLGTGEDQVQGQIVEPQQTLPSFDIVGSVSDLTLDALTQTTAVVAEGNLSFGVIQPYLPAYIDGALLMQRLSISKDQASQGQGNWDGVLFPKVKAVPMSSDGMAEKKITDWKRHVICNPSSILPNGLAITSSNFKTSNGVEFPFSSPNKAMYYGWKADGIASVFNLPQSAIPGSGLLAPGYPNVTRKDGVLVTPTVTLVSTNYQFDFGSVPTAGLRLIAQVEFL